MTSSAEGGLTGCLSEPVELEHPTDGILNLITKCPTGLSEGLVRVVRPNFGVVRTHAFLISAADGKSL